MAERQHDRQVGIEVDEVPGLVGEAASGDGDRQHRRSAIEQSERDDGRQQALVAGDEVGQLTGDVLAVPKLVAQGLKDGVADQQANREVAVPLVEHGHSLQAEGVLEPRQPRHEQQLPEDEVGSEQPRHPADAVEERPMRCG